GINPSGYIEQYNCDENTITVANGGASAGYVNFISTKFWLGADCFSIKPKSEIHNKYLFHFLKSNEFKLKNYQYGAAIPHLQRNTITSLEIPIPPIKIQERIVKILDNFEKICNDLKIGLPAEIEARQKQYEFYRDKLLSFKQT
ncbi:MAG: restriction endonuclease subunit S, partial [Malacoplasma sp.]|nr:restriction endonuclease subunit S [Malacoplasma sp.]